MEAKVCFRPRYKLALVARLSLYNMTSALNRPSGLPSKVALFVTSATPFSDEWLKNLCTKAEQSALVSDSLGEPIQLKKIPGKFEGWTPFQLVRDYVFPHLFLEVSPFAYISFVVLDDKSHADDQVLIVGVHPNSFKGAQLEIEGTIRLGAESAVELPIIFHEGHQGITAYPSDPYDNDAERNVA